MMKDASIVIDETGEPVIVTTQAYNKFGWRFVLLSPYSNISMENSTQRYTIYIVGIGCIFFAIISAYIITRIFSKPIIDLKNTMLKVRNNDLTIRHENKSQDEIGELTNAFNSLLDTVEDLMGQIYEEEKNKQKLQLKLIQAQIKPHFLYNVLEMISSFVRDGMKFEALSSITSLAHFYRVSLSSGSDIITIEKEIDLIENYLTLQRLRYIEFMDFQLSFNPSILGYSIPKLTLQPIIENAIYHGLKGKCIKGLISVTGYLENGRVVFEIFDDGAGMSEESLEKVRTSIENYQITNVFGLASVIKRLNIYFNQEANFDIKSELGKYTDVIISFPAK
jgi:two-component system sensor histidine kinase YesM